MINFLLLHGWYGDSQENWFPWMKSQLENEGHTVFAPDLPDPIHPTPEAWQAVLDEFKEDMKDGIVIGHSLGAPTAIRCITQNNLPIRHLIFVAPTFPKQRRVIDLSQYE